MACPNRLFVAYKPAGIASNRFLSRIKHRYGVKKAGFSGTLDPFAQGTLIVAFGQYTKLFRFLNKAPKRYRATLWLGAQSDTLDIEAVRSIQSCPPLSMERIHKVCRTLEGEQRYLPPRYSAKKIGGRRAYTLARREEAFELDAITSRIYALRPIHYLHPFLTFEITIDEGGYVRSIAQMIAEALGCRGALSALDRLSEGAFVYEHERPLDPLAYLRLPPNRYLGDYEDIKVGRKLSIERFACRDAGEYSLVLDNMLTIVELSSSGVSYLLNGLKLC